MFTLQIGQIVTNFGVIAEVIDFHPTTNDPILKEVGGNMKWVASADKCIIVESTVMHKEGLVMFS